MKYVVWKRAYLCVHMQVTQLGTPQHEQFPQRINCGEQENSLWSGREDKGAESSEIIGKIPKNHSYFRWWQSHIQSDKLALSSQPSSATVA